MSRNLRSSLPPTASSSQARLRGPRYRPSNAWKPEEDDLLLEQRAAGMSWKDIAHRNFPNDAKSDNACRKRHARLMDKQRRDEWDGAKLEALAIEYSAMREQLWDPLASRLGEDWRVIEEKCMENGHRNLQNIAQTAGMQSPPQTSQRLPSVEQVMQQTSVSTRSGARRHTLAAAEAESSASNSFGPPQSQLRPSMSAPERYYYPASSSEYRTLPPLAPAPPAYVPYVSQAEFTPTATPRRPEELPTFMPRMPPTSIASLLHPHTPTSG